MVFTEVSIFLHNGETEPKEITDYVDSQTGKFINEGVQAAASLTRHETVYIKESDAEMIIPYHAVLAWSVTKTTEEIEPPEDAFCQPVGCDEKVTVTWTDSDGETVLGTDEVCKGKVPEYSGATPSTGGTFIGWNTEAGADTPISPLPPATADITYYAVYSR